MPRNRFAIVCCVVVAALAMAGASALPAGARVESAGTKKLTIKGFAFHPETLKAKVGDTIKVSNKDDTTHTVTANNTSFDTGDIDADSSATFTVKKAGTFKFHCDIHNYMKGTIKVSK
jgi:plastocyanin